MPIGQAQVHSTAHTMAAQRFRIGPAAIHEYRLSNKGSKCLCLFSGRIRLAWIDISVNLGIDPQLVPNPTLGVLNDWPAGFVPYWKSALIRLLGFVFRCVNSKAGAVKPVAFVCGTKSSFDVIDGGGADERLAGWCCAALSSYPIERCY